MSDFVRAKAATLVPTQDQANMHVVRAGDVVDLDVLGTPKEFRDAIDNDPWTSKLFERLQGGGRPRATGRKNGEGGQSKDAPTGEDDLAAEAAKLAQKK